jgi:sarcinarray family protein
MNKKTILFLILTISLFFLSMMPQSLATENKYGTLETFFSKNKKNWEPATVENITLKRGEIFYIKAEITSEIDLLSIDLHIWETGENSQENSTYKQLSGPNCFFNVYNTINISKNQNFTFIWKFQVKPNADWVNAKAPFNILVQYDKNPRDDKKIYYTVVNPYIENTIWENYDPNKNYTGNIYDRTDNIIEKNGENNTNLSDTNKQKTPGYEILPFILSSIILSILYRKKKHYFFKTVIYY